MPDLSDKVNELLTAEIARVLAKPLEHFWARNKVKNDAGFDATACPSAAPIPPEVMK